MFLWPQNVSKEFYLRIQTMFSSTIKDPFGCFGWILFLANARLLWNCHTELINSLFFRFIYLFFFLSSLKFLFLNHTKFIKLNWINDEESFLFCLQMYFSCFDIDLLISKKILARDGTQKYTFFFFRLKLSNNEFTKWNQYSNKLFIVCWII